MNSDLDPIPMNYPKMNTTADLPPSEACLNPHIISTEGIIRFVYSTGWVVLISSFFSSFLQIYVIRCALFNIRRRASDECLHLFLLSMTIGDFVLTSLCYPLEIVPRVMSDNFAIPKALNICMHFVTWVGLSASSISLVLLNLDKLLYFKMPLRYSTFVNRRRGILIVVCVWSACIGFVSVAWLTGCFRCVDEYCEVLGLFSGKTAMYVAFSFSVCVLPTVTSLGVALYILKVVSMHKKRLAEEQALCGTEGAAARHAVASRLRTFYFIFMTTIFTAFTLLPYRILGIKRSLEPDRQQDCISVLFLWIMNYLINLNAILNPLITVTVLPQYRANFVRRLLGMEVQNEKTKSTAVDL